MEVEVSGKEWNIQLEAYEETKHTVGRKKKGGNLWNGERINLIILLKFLKSSVDNRF